MNKSRMLLLISAIMIFGSFALGVFLINFTNIYSSILFAILCYFIPELGLIPALISGKQIKNDPNKIYRVLCTTLIIFGFILLTINTFASFTDIGF